MNVFVHANVKQEAKIRALREGRELSEIVAELLETWVES